MVTKTIEISFANLAAAYKPLLEMGQQKYEDPRTHFYIAKVLKAFNFTWAVYMRKMEAIKKANPELAPNAAQLFVEQRHDKIQAAIEEVNNEIATLECNQIFASRLAPNLPVPGHLMVLDWLIVDDISEFDASDTKQET